MSSKIPQEEPTLQQLKLRFFDIHANINSDTPAYINLFSQMYRRFQEESFCSYDQPSLNFSVRARTDNPWGKPVIIVDGEVTPLEDPALLEGYVYERILCNMIANVRNHFLIHAGVVSWGDKGVILAGNACHGKTTLVLELVRRGFKFLSDEMAALGREDYQVHPFPRCLRIRPGTLELAGFPMAAVGAATWLDKMLLDIEEIKPGSLGKAVPPSSIVILKDRAETEKTGSEGSEKELVVVLDRLDDTLVAASGQIEGVTKVFTKIDGPHAMLRIFTTRTAHALPEIERICQERKVLVLHVIKGKFDKPNFDATPRLEAISRSQAVIELLRRFQSGYKSALLQDELNGSSTQLFMELFAIISKAKCYHLLVGSLSQMADLVCGLV